MPPLIEKFPKATSSKAQAQQAATDHLNAGAVSSIVTEDSSNYVVTTVLPEPAADDAGTGKVVAAAAGAFTGAAVAGPLGAAVGAVVGSAVGGKLHGAAAPAGTGGPYIAAHPAALLGQSVGSGECVAYVQAASGAPHTSNWRRGSLVKGNASVQPGTAIATFDANGTYGNHTDGTSHAAIYVSQDQHGLTVYDQWKHHPVQPVHQRLIRFGGAQPVNDGNKFYVIV